MHQTFLTIQVCSYPGVQNDESHLIMNWRCMANFLLLMPPKHYIRAGVVPCANTPAHAQELERCHQKKAVRGRRTSAVVKLTCC